MNLRDKAFKIANNPKYNGYERRLASMAYKFFDKKSAGSGMKSFQINSLHMNFINQLLENSKDKKSILLLKTIFRETI